MHFVCKLLLWQCFLNVNWISDWQRTRQLTGTNSWLLKMASILRRQSVFQEWSSRIQIRSLVSLFVDDRLFKIWLTKSSMLKKMVFYKTEGNGGNHLSSLITSVRGQSWKQPRGAGEIFRGKFILALEWIAFLCRCIVYRYNKWKSWQHMEEDVQALF